jgi:radical SAM superfamily enzyme YgiQ (UPF0313 family)
MRVCLIVPPSAFLLDDRVFPSLGIMRIAAVLEKRGIKVDLLDLSGDKDWVKEIDNYQPNEEVVFGITATTPQLPGAIAISRQIRSRGKVILGGAHISFVNAAHKKIGGRATKALNEMRDEFDVLVAGDGDEAIFLALTGKGLIDADDVNSPLFLTNQRLNELPFPARHLIDMKSYHFYIDGEPTTSLIAQLGCPFECGFCGGRSTAFLRKIRTRTSENIVEEMRQVYLQYGYKGFMFHDDELNVNKNFLDLLDKIHKLQEELGVEFKCRGFVRSSLFTEEHAIAMVRANFKGILVGFESGSPRMLRNMKKATTVDQNSKCWEIACKYGLKVKALMSIGHPGESRETIEETKAWLRTMPMENREDLDFTVIAVYPGTTYYDEAVETDQGWCYTINGDRLYSQEVDCRKVTNYYKGAPDAYNCFTHTDYLTSREILELRMAAEKEFGKVIPYKDNRVAP